MFINAVLDKFSLSEFRKFGLGSRSQKASVIKLLWLPLTAKMVLYIYTQIFFIVATLQKPNPIII